MRGKLTVGGRMYDGGKKKEKTAENPARINLRGAVIISKTRVKPQYVGIYLTHWPNLIFSIVYRIASKIYIRNILRDRSV